MSETNELKALLEDQGRAWEEFKRKNDQRLAAIESKGYAPADLTETVDRLNAELSRVADEAKKRADEIEKKYQRPGAGGGGQSPEAAEHKAAFGDFLRKGDPGNLRELERKALRTTSDIDGGFLVTEEMDAAIDRVATVTLGFRRVANVRQIGGKSYEKVVKTSGLSGRWVGENEAGGESTNPKYSSIEITAEEIEVEPWVYNRMLDDASFNVEADLIDDVGNAEAETEGAAFVSGTGVKQPRGILSYTIVANASYAWGKVGYIASGGAGAFATSNPADALIDLQHALKQQYRSGAAWLTGDSTLAKIRQIKDGSGNFYLWQPDPAAGFSGLILGAPVVVDDNMPVIASNSYSLAFGNWARAYTIVDRRGRVLIRDNITAKGTTKFNFRKRVGGGIVQFEALKLMKFATS
jgi:HK97 family phage major capsid protein